MTKAGWDCPQCGWVHPPDRCAIKGCELLSVTECLCAAHRDYTQDAE